MQPLTHHSTIHAIASFTQWYIDEHWESVFQSMRQEMIDLYPTMGDTVYGRYIDRLVRPILTEFKRMGFRNKPRLPGGFMASREWGPEEDRQRWFWGKITAADGSDVGTLAFGFYHDHYEIRIPRAPQIIALEATTKSDVLAALSRLMPEIADAADMKQEIADYMAQNQG